MNSAGVAVPASLVPPDWKFRYPIRFPQPKNVYNNNVERPACKLCLVQFSIREKLTSHLKSEWYYSFVLHNQRMLLLKLLQPTSMKLKRRCQICGHWESTTDVYVIYYFSDSCRRIKLTTFMGCVICNPTGKTLHSVK